MTDWRHLKIEGLGPISKRVAVFKIGPPLARLPFAGFQVKVVEHPDGSFFGVPNVARRGADGTVDWIGSFGDTVEEALEKTLRWFAESLGEMEGATEDDFEWAAPEDF